jgi:hypothetical protein
MSEKNSIQELNTDCKVDKNQITISIKNIYIGLNKGCSKGAFELKEAAELSNNLDYLAAVINMLLSSDNKNHD